MKILQIIAWSAFVIGIIFRIFHLPGDTLLLVLGAVALAIHSLIYLVKNFKTHLPNSFLHLAFSILTIYVLFRIKYWSCGPNFLGYSLLFLLAFIVVIIAFTLQSIARDQRKFPLVLLIIYFLFFIRLSFIHTERIYYFFQLNAVLNSASRNTDYDAWDKYSWFLYQANKPEEALKANKEAQMAANLCLAMNSEDKASQFLTLIKEHEQQIQDKTWNSYREFDAHNLENSPD